MPLMVGIIYYMQVVLMLLRSGGSVLDFQYCLRLLRQTFPMRQSVLNRLFDPRQSILLYRCGLQTHFFTSEPLVLIINFQRLVDDLLRIYPSANVWLVGHSLGGALASLLGATYGLPAVAFEAPGERLAASRLHLPLPPPISVRSPEPLSLPSSSHPWFTFWSHLLYVKFPFHVSGNRPYEAESKHVLLTSPSHHPVATTHVYHTADPIPQGTCTGFRSPCANAGYALETRCHLGQTIVFDTVQRLRWKVDVRTHTIKTLVHDVLEGDVWWGDDDEEEYEGPAFQRRRKARVLERKNVVPKPIIEMDCSVSSCHFSLFYTV